MIRTPKNGWSNLNKPKHLLIGQTRIYYLRFYALVIMLIYGLGLLAFSYLAGQLFGDFLGEIIGVQANVGGVGFAMLLLVVLHTYFQKKQWVKANFDDGIGFWSNMYIPVIVAMSASQNALLAFNKGILPIIAGTLIVVIGFLLVPIISKIKTTAP